MKTTKIKAIIYLLGFGGAALFTILLVRQGVMSVGSAVLTAGWAIAGIAAFHFVPILLDTLAWRVLFPKAVRPRWQSLHWSMQKQTTCPLWYTALLWGHF